MSKPTDQAIIPASERIGGKLALLAAMAGPFFGLVAVVALFSWLTWDLDPPQKFILHPETLKLIAVHTAIPATVAVGMTIIIISGGIDLSVGFVVSLVTVVTVLAYRYLVAAGSPLAFLGDSASVWAIAAGMGTGALFGFSNGVLITRLKVVPFVVTLGMMGVAQGLARLLSGGSRIEFPDPVPAWVRWLGTKDPDPAWLQFAPACWVAILLAILFALLLRYTVLGRYCYVIGSNEAAARLCGIRVERVKVVLYTLAGLITGLGGVLQLARSSGVGTYNAAAGLELEVIAAVVIGGGSLSGGEGRIGGTVLGALLITVLAEGCMKLDLQMEFRFIIIGLIIVLVSAVNSWRQRRAF